MAYFGIYPGLLGWGLTRNMDREIGGKQYRVSSRPYIRNPKAGKWTGYGNKQWKEPNMLLNPDWNEKVPKWRKYKNEWKSRVPDRSDPSTWKTTNQDTRIEYEGGYDNDADIMQLNEQARRWANKGSAQDDYTPENFPGAERGGSGSGSSKIQVRKSYISYK